MATPFYQLTTDKGKPTFYILFDNMDQKERLVIYVMIYHLNNKEYNETVEKIKQYHGDSSLEKNEPLEFMKYIVCVFKDEPPKIIDMDTLRYIIPNSNMSLKNSLMKQKLEQGLPIELNFSPVIIKSGPSFHHGEKSMTNGYVRYKTKKNGHITIKFSRYKNPNVRNGISLNIQRKVTKETLYGALVYATDPRFLRVSKLLPVPEIPTPEIIQNMIHNKYWEADTTSKYSYMGQKTNDSILIPRGKVKKRSLDEYTEL